MGRNGLGADDIENPGRRFGMQSGLALAAAIAAAGVTSEAAQAQTTITDADILNFALNLEYLEAEFYCHAAFGHGLGSSLIGGTGTLGGVTGGHRVPFKSKKTRQIAREIAYDEIHHVQFLRTALGGARVSRPAIDLKHSFTAAAKAAASHTGSLTGSDEVLEAAFRRSGVLRVNNIADLFYMAEVLAKLVELLSAVIVFGDEVFVGDLHLVALCFGLFQVCKGS